MKNINLNATKLATLTVFVLSLLFSTVSFAQQSEAIYKATIPFEFQLNGKILPAGEYVVKMTDHFIQIRPASEAKGVGTVTTRTSRNKQSEKNMLVFNVYENQYFLSQLWFEGSELVREVPMSRAEAEIAKKGTEAHVQLALGK